MLLAADKWITHGFLVFCLLLEAMKIVTLFALSAAVKFRVHPTADDEWLRP